MGGSGRVLDHGLAQDRRPHLRPRASPYARCHSIARRPAPSRPLQSSGPAGVLYHAATPPRRARHRAARPAPARPRTPSEQPSRRRRHRLPRRSGLLERASIRCGWASAAPGLAQSPVRAALGRGGPMAGSLRVQPAREPVPPSEFAVRACVASFRGPPCASLASAAPSIRQPQHAGGLEPCGAPSRGRLQCCHTPHA